MPTAPKKTLWIIATIDEVAVYSRALSDVELRAYYEATR